MNRNSFKNYKKMLYGSPALVRALLLLLLLLLPLLLLLLLLLLQRRPRAHSRSS